MLLHRIITAAALLAVLSLLFVYGGGALWQGLLWLIIIGLYLEYRRMKPMGFLYDIVFFLMVSSVILYMSIANNKFFLFSLLATFTSYIAVLFGGGWLSYALYQGKSGASSSLTSFAISCFLLIPFCVVVSYLIPKGGFLLNGDGNASRDGLWILLALSAICWISDSGAFFIGRSFGKTKLAAKISPNKSIEGALGGAVFTLSYVFILWMTLDIFHDKSFLGWVLFFIASLMLSALSVMGDLFESLIKRESGFKDSGRLLPGHGGLLDRLDSLLIVIPVGFFWLKLYESIAKYGA